MLLGAAVGDALGLPSEGVSRRRARKLFRGELRHRLLFKWGMVSDDTDHTVFVSQSLLAHSDSVERFRGRLARSLRLSLLALPVGIGGATLRASVRLCLGISPARSGVYSAGNAPAMRAAPVGAFFAGRPEQLDAFLKASTALTHTDPRALVGARAVAHLAARSVAGDATQRPAWTEVEELLLRAGREDDEWCALVGAMGESLKLGHSAEQFADAIGAAKGVTGYVFQTVPVAVYVWYLNFGDYEKTVRDAVRCGGDTDTVASIAGGLAGAVVGERGIPASWVAGIFDWPRGVAVLRLIGDSLAEKSGGADINAPVRYFWPGLLLRNAILFVVVLAHALRRLAPPY